MISYKDKNKKKTFSVENEKKANNSTSKKVTVSKENMSTKPVEVKKTVDTKKISSPTTELQYVQQVAQKNKNEKYNNLVKASNEVQTAKNNVLNKNGYALADVANKTMLERGNNIGKTLSYDNRQLATDLEANRQETVRKMQEVISKDKDVQKKQKIADEAANDYLYADYLNNVMQEEGKEYNLWDKTGGRALSAIPDYFSSFGLGTKYRGENGREYALPSKYEIRDQNVAEQSSGLERFAGDVLHEGGKQMMVKGVNLLTGGIGGSALYFTDIFGDTLKQNVNEGYDAKTSLVNATLKTGQNYIKQWAMGGFNGELTGGQTSQLQDILTSKWNTLIKNPVVANILGSGSAEFIDEFTDTYIENIIDTATKNNAGLDIGKYLDVMFSPETFKEAFYSGAVGFGTGTVGGYDPNPEIIDLSINKNSNKISQNQMQSAQQTAQEGATAQTLQNTNNQANETNKNNIDNKQDVEYNEGEKESAQNEFRRIQAESREKLNSENWGDSSKAIDEDLRGRIKGTLSEEIKRRGYDSSNNDGVLKITSKGNQFNLHENVDAKTFHDMFEIARTYTDNGELVDLHPVETNEDSTGYNEMKNYLSDDGMQGFSITKDGDVVSVFNADPTRKGFLRGITNEINKNGKTLDCYNSSVQPLNEIYSNIFGWKTASVMDHNMDYDHDNIAKNHNNPKVSFMVNPNQLKPGVTDADLNRKFGKTQYDEAVAYRESLMKGGKGNKNDFVFGKDGYFKEMKKGTGDSSFSNEQKQTRGKIEGPALSEAKNAKKETSKVVKESFKTKQSEKSKTTKTDTMKEIRQEVENKTGKTMSKHIETSSKATNTVEDVKNMNPDDIVYNRETHKQSYEQALRELEGNDIDTNINDIHAKFRGTERLTNVDSAKITELMKQTKSLAEDAVKSGNDAEYNRRMEQFRTLKGDYAVALSESGQFTEYAKVIKELDPETQIDVLERVLEREQRRGNKKYEGVKLNEDLVEQYKKAKTDAERDVIIDKIYDDTSRQIKITFADKANEFRFLSMLGNLKTHGRNIVGNAGMYSLQSFKDGVAAIGEDVYDKVSKKMGKGGLEVRTKTLKPATKEVSKYVSDTVDSFMKDEKSKYNESRGIKGDLEGRTKKFSDKNPIGWALNRLSKLNKRALDWEDKKFSSSMTKQAMKGFLTANGIKTEADIKAHPELVAQALDYAIFKGKEATFHQDSTTATAIRNFRDKLYTGSGYSQLGGLAIDATLPFVSTPANIAKNALEYTPIIGFGDINKQLQQAPDSMKANVFIDSISKQFSGAALMAVGAFLASKGLVKGAGEGDKEDKTEASLGNASYSIKIGNSTYDLSWLSPTAIPFFEGVEVFNALKKAKSKDGVKATDVADLIDTMFGTLNPMTDMSVLQSIERIITSIAYGGNAVKSATSTTFSSYLQQYIPTLLSQFAQIGDTKQRNTNTGGNVLEKTRDQIKYKIPGKRNTLPEKTDVWGDTNKTASNLGQRAFEALLSPANRKDYKVDDTTKELERLAREIDDTSVLPTVKNKKITVNGEEYNLKGKDYANLQKTYGKTAKKNLDKLTSSQAYKNADDIEKKKMVSNLYDYASYKAKEEYAKNNGIDFDSGKQTSYAMIDAFNIPYEKYVENRVSGNDNASTMLDKLNKMGLSEAQKGAVMNYYNRAYYVDEEDLYNTLRNSNLSDKQKELVMDKYEKYITDAERERYKRAQNIGVDYDIYTRFRSYVSDVRGDSKNGGLTKDQKIRNWIQSQSLTVQQKKNLYNDYKNNQGIKSYYK